MRFSGSCHSSLLLIFFALAAACSSKNDISQLGSANACALPGAPTGCGQSCNANLVCPSGVYCGSEGTCRAECTKDGGQCGGGKVCSWEGRCTSPAEANRSETNLNSNCAAISLTGLAKRPYVMLLVDATRSMSQSDLPNSAFVSDDNTDTTRWDAIRNLLIGKTAERTEALQANASVKGIIYQYQNKVDFGLQTFHGKPSPGGSDDEQCVGFGPTVQHEPQPNAYNFIVNESGFATQSTDDWTPIGPSVRYAASLLPVTAPNGEHPILVLATDGEPNWPDRTTYSKCPTDDEWSAMNATAKANKKGRRVSNNARTDAEKAVDDAFKSEKKIKTYVIYVGEVASSSPSSAQTLMQKLANLGVGKAATGSDNAPYSSVNSADALGDAFNGIIREQISCRYELKDADGNAASITASTACDSKGTVKINGTLTPLPCDDPNGWSLDANKTHVVLNGAACEALKDSANPSVDAVFPCGSASVSSTN